MKKWFRKRRVIVLLLTLLLSYCVLGIGFVASEYSQRNAIPEQQTTAARPKPLDVSDIDIYQLFALTNEKRSEVGIKKLSLDPRLASSAQEKCNDMVGKNYWSHNAPDGSEPWKFIKSQGIHQYRKLGENQASGYRTAEDVIGGWMISTAHKDNLLDSRFAEVGFGVCKSGAFIGTNGAPSLIVVQHFAQL